MQMAFKANLIIPALLTKCLFVYFQLYLVYLVKSTGYIMKWNQIKELLFWLHGNIMIWNQNQRVIVLAA